MTQQFPLLFAPFRLGKHDLQSRIVVTGHAAQFYDEQKLPTEDYAYFLIVRSHRLRRWRHSSGLLPSPLCFLADDG